MHAGIHSVHVDYKLQKVTVWGICNKDDVLVTIRKKRREARFWDQAELEAAEGKVEDETAVAKASRLVAAKGHRLRLSWKKLFPLYKRTTDDRPASSTADSRGSDVSPTAFLDEVVGKPLPRLQM
ncbi:hypothetical protein BHE74_00020797 [Ensete ventricosum]|nr:hypothetical protein BHE74_00020797 [Ensete ventricosum]